ncbi:MAG: ABC transporter substrate-binding protein [Chloroflexi bacterium]|nr:ABC transporter substrate-binding protein [Chloroflexota bacterium]
MKFHGTGLAILIGAIFLVGCAAPQPTATATRPPAAAPTTAPTATKAPTATPTKRPLTKVTVTAASTGIVHLPLFVAKDRGYFAEEGLDLEFVATGAPASSVAAVVGGSAEFVSSTPTEVINAAAQGNEILVIVAALFDQPFTNVTMRKDVADRLGITEKSPLSDKVKALKGLKIARTSPGALTDTFARYTLKLANLDPERDAELVSVGAGAVLAALKQGAVDVIIRSSPDPDIAVAEGWAITLVNYQTGEVPELAGTLNQTLLMRRDIVEKNPELTLSAVRGVTKGQKFLQRESEVKEYAKSLFPDLDPKAYEVVWKNNYPGFTKDSVPTRAGIQKHIDVLNVFAETPIKVSLDRLYVASFAEQAKQELANWQP